MAFQSVVILGLILHTAAAAFVSISNAAPRFDVSRRAMDIHDGGLFQDGHGRYWYYGMGYMNCTEEKTILPPMYCPGIFESFGGCGFRTDHPLNVYSSTDLLNWSFEGDALPLQTRPEGVYFRPKIIHDKLKTGDYFLWVNLLEKSGDIWPLDTPLYAYSHSIYFAVFRASSPRGPFTLVNKAAHTQVAFPGDVALLVDRTGTAYVAYDAWANDHKIRVEQLDGTWTNALPESPNTTTGDLTAKNHEAPILFERRGWYYLLYGRTCCFCGEGAGLLVKTAAHPLGPWTDSNGGIDYFAWGHWEEGIFKRKCGRTVPTQNNFVAQVPDSKGDVQYVFMADLWYTAPDRKKSHDAQFWAVLEFDDSVPPTQAPPIKPFDFSSSVSIDVPGAPAGARAPEVAGPLGPNSALQHIYDNQHACANSNGPTLTWQNPEHLKTAVLIRNQERKLR